MKVFLHHKLFFIEMKTPYGNDLQQQQAKISKVNIVVKGGP